jgi:hypothetical protein
MAADNPGIGLGSPRRRHTPDTNDAGVGHEAVGLLQPAGFIAHRPGVGHRRVGATPMMGSRQVPMVELDEPDMGAGRFYAAAVLDDRGRLSDRSAVKQLAWRAGMPITIDSHPQTGLVLIYPGGSHRLTRDGYVRVPAKVRHNCRLEGGDRVLMVASIERQVLGVYLPSAVEAMIAAYHEALGTGGVSP